MKPFTISNLLNIVSTLRTAAWGEIARPHGKPIEECRENWNKLRNFYNNAMKRRKKKSGQAEKIIAPWRFEEQMAFLKPYLEGRQTTGNLNATVTNEDYPESVTSPESLPSRTSTPTSTVSNKRKATPDRNNYLSDMMEMMWNSQEMRQKKLELDDLDYFFLSMRKMVKKLPRVDQIRIKMDLHKSVSEAELKQLESQNSILRTPIMARTHINSHIQDNTNSGSGNFSQAHTSSYSSPPYLLDLSNTEFSPEAAGAVSTNEENMFTHYEYVHFE